MAEVLVVNTGPLIALQRMGALHLGQQLPYEVICPDEVRRELDAGVALGHADLRPPWLGVRTVEPPLSPLVRAALDPGEAAVIHLALQLGGARVCIDDWKGRRAAAALGLAVTGSLGLLARAKTLGLIPAVRPFVERAVSAGIGYHPTLVQQVLQGLGETS